MVTGLSKEQEAPRLQPAQHPHDEALELLVAQVHQQPVGEDEVKTEKKIEMDGLALQARNLYIIQLDQLFVDQTEIYPTVFGFVSINSNCRQYLNTHLFLGSSSFVTSAWMKEALLW